MPPRSRSARPSLDDARARQARGARTAAAAPPARGHGSRRTPRRARKPAPSSSRSPATTTSASRTTPRSSQRAIEATRRFGAGAGSSRLVNGNHPLYAELERKLAALKGTEDAVVFGSGYLTNVGVIPALVGRTDLILLDELCHSCLLDGRALERRRVLEFRHNDVAHLGELLRARARAHRHCLVLTDGVFSMEGDLAPLRAARGARRTSTTRGS